MGLVSKRPSHRYYIQMQSSYTEERKRFNDTASSLIEARKIAIGYLDKSPMRIIHIYTDKEHRNLVGMIDRDSDGINWYPRNRKSWRVVRLNRDGTIVGRR